MKGPFISEIAPKTYAINEYGLSAMFLLKGTERSLLIDTGGGVCDLQKILTQLTDQPVDVVLTHGHLDHVGGCSIFDKIFVNEKDRDMIHHISKKELQAYCDQSGRMGGYDACNTNTLLMDGMIETLLSTAEKIKSLQPFFDQNFNGYIGYAGAMDCFSMPESVTDDVIHICREVLRGTAQAVEVTFLGNAGQAVSYGCARVVF